MTWITKLNSAPCPTYFGVPWWSYPSYQSTLHMVHSTADLLWSHGHSGHNCDLPHPPRTHRHPYGGHTASSRNRHGHIHRLHGTVQPWIHTSRKNRGTNSCIDAWLERLPFAQKNFKCIFLIYNVWFKFHRKLFLRVQLTLVLVMAWHTTGNQSPSHYLKQFWLKFHDDIWHH